MYEGIILASLAVVVLAYCLLAYHEKNWITILTPFFLFSVPGWYVLELVYGAIFGYSASVYAYCYCYLTYALGVVATVAGFVIMPNRSLGIFIKVPRLVIPGMPFFFLIFAVLLYAQILVQFPGMIFSPRQIYEVTRSGFGLQFFLSAFAAYFGFILLLFSRKLSRKSITAFSVIALLVLYLHGSKSQILNFLLMGLYFAVFVRGWRIDFKKIVGLTAVAIVLVSALFYVTSYGNSGTDLVVSMAGYAEYTRNASMVIDDSTLAPQLGRLSLESKTYIMVPRALFPDKPKDYGAFWLAKRYFPLRFEADAGAPDFGIGFLYADFGVFAIIYWIFGAFLAGAILKVLAVRLRRRPDAGTFLLFLIFMDVGLIPTGAGGVPLIFYYVLAHVAKILCPAALPNVVRSPALPRADSLGGDLGHA